ncbi:hypothetical protein [Leptospira licerasiae]|uniref:ATP-binding protein n=1 Tax=Leptospira licerasiae str. MMD4847 TaxID=1049971 RepID=A0ABN0HCF6_9LEPT|nr:hypothetical protein [Leptospira licerasiae]EIE01353.1 hypothetical protein LEP1GSC185_3452 [Leptospira licerasiae serovar Varillal str. VAR 010]EJZ43315.1 hypothetical protein LEP1GSC178_3065 [Leptospira licerasiae str. MMD4847]
MSPINYINLNREFCLIEKDESFGSYYEDYHIGFNSVILSWENLLSNKLVVILSEAGTGKTVELINKAQELKEQGKYSFCIKIESIPSNFDYSFVVGSIREFQEWKNSETQGWIFLDSVDEAKLISRTNFDIALRKFYQILGSKINQSNIYITSRVSEWRTKEDFRKVYSSHINALSQFKTGLDESIPLELLIVNLMDLDDRMIREFLQFIGVNKIDQFLHEVDLKGANLFLKRPIDLEELAQYWMKNHKIGGYVALLENNIELRLGESNETYHDNLSLNELKEGVQKLAGGVTLTGIPKIKLPECESSISGLNIQKLFPDWEKDKLNRLLARPIFSPAIYGTVAFYHRIPREYLAAKWFLRLYEARSSKYKIEEILFKKKYSEEFIAPGLKAICAWIAQEKPEIFDKVLQIAPEVLLTEGSPSEYNPNTKILILREFCRKYSNKPFGRFGFDIFSIRRFATNSNIGNEVKELLVDYLENKEIREFLLRLIWQGEYTECAEIALEIVNNDNFDEYSRIVCIRYISTLPDIAFQENVLGSLLKKDKYKISLILECIDCFSSASLKVELMLEFLSNVRSLTFKENARFRDVFVKYFTKLNQIGLINLVSGINSIVYKESVNIAIEVQNSSEFSWFREPTRLLCAYIIKKRNLNDNNKELIKLILFCSLWTDDHSGFENRGELKELILLNERLALDLIWQDCDLFFVKNEREGKKDFPEPTISNIYFIHHSLWEIGKISFDLAIRSFQEQVDIKKRKLALRISYLLYLKYKNKKNNQILKDNVKDNIELKEELIKIVKEQRNYRRSERAWGKRSQININSEKRNLQRQAEVKKSIEMIFQNSKVGDLDLQAIEIALGKLQYEVDPKFDFQSENVEILKENFGDEFVENYARISMQLWRLLKPSFRSERIKSDNHYLRKYALIGIGFEVFHSNVFFKNLNVAEVELLCRYAFLEYHFPNWFESLYLNYSKEVEVLLLREIEYEMKLPAEEQDSIFDFLLHAISSSFDELKQSIKNKILKLLYEIPIENIRLLTDATRCLIKLSDYDRTILINIAERRLVTDRLDLRIFWFCLLVTVDPESGINRFENYVRSQVVVNQKEIVGNFIRSLCNRTRATFDIGRLSSENVYSLYKLSYEFIKYEEDNIRLEGVPHQVDIRDEEQMSRGFILSYLCDIPGEETYNKLIELSEIHPVIELRPNFLRMARERAENDSERYFQKLDDILEFEKGNVRKPESLGDLHELSMDHVFEIKSALELGESSEAKLLISVLEADIRNHLKNRLEDLSRGNYRVEQEIQFSDGNRTDLRLINNRISGSITLELKVVENLSFLDLIKGLRDQLIGKYLLDKNSKYGIYILFNRSTRNWDSPSTGEKIGFVQVVDELNTLAKGFIEESKKSIEAVLVIGIDLTLKGGHKTKNSNKKKEKI